MATTGKYKSHLQLLIEKATDGQKHDEENWSLFMRICDYIDTVEEAPKEGAKIIRKRLGCKQHETITLTLTLLETCMKNCSRSFKARVASPKFMQELVKVLSPKNHPPIEIQRLVLGLIQAWAVAFRGVPELKEFNKTYQELQDKGVEFPPLESEKLLVASVPTAKKLSSTQPAMPGVRYAQPPPAARTDSPPPLPGDPSKLTAELDVVRQNARVFREMLTATTPAQATQSDRDLLQDLNGSCIEMQKRIVKIIEGGQFEELTVELLVVNDELNSALQRYEQFQASTSSSCPPSSAVYVGGQVYGDQPVYDDNGIGPRGRPSATAGLSADIYSNAVQPSTDGAIYNNEAASSGGEWGTLIDLGSPTPNAQTRPPPSYNIAELADLSVYDNNVIKPSENSVYGNSSEFNQQVYGNASQFSDPFVVPTPFMMHSTQYSSAAKPSYQSNPGLSMAGGGSATAPPVIDKESELEEMEQWLKANPKSGAGSEQKSSSMTAASSDPFDAFLSRRATEAERLPPASSRPPTDNLLDL